MGWLLNHPDSFRYQLRGMYEAMACCEPVCLKEVAGEKDSGDVDLAKGVNHAPAPNYLSAGDEKTAELLSMESVCEVREHWTITYFYHEVLQTWQNNTTTVFSDKRSCKWAFFIGGTKPPVT